MALGKLQRGIGWGLAAFGCIGLAIEIDKLVGGVPEKPVLGFVLAAVFIMSGLALARPRWLGFKQSARTREATRAVVDPVSEVIRAAQKLGGRITVLEAVSDSGLSMADAEQGLRRLTEQGHCEELVGEGGLVFFRFPEFERDDLKHDILEEVNAPQDAEEAVHR